MSFHHPFHGKTDAFKPRNIWSKRDCLKKQELFEKTRTVVPKLELCLKNENCFNELGTVSKKSEKSAKTVSSERELSRKNKNCFKNQELSQKACGKCLKKTSYELPRNKSWELFLKGGGNCDTLGPSHLYFKIQSLETSAQPTRDNNVEKHIQGLLETIIITATFCQTVTYQGASWRTFQPKLKK